MTLRFFVLSATFALAGVFAACDAVSEPPPASTFEATVSGAQHATITGTAGTSYQERGIPTLWLMLINDDPASGGISFSRAYELTLRRGTYDVGPGAALAGGFHGFLTLPVASDSVTTYWAFEGTLTVTAVTAGRAEGSFSFRAGPGPGVMAPEVLAEGTFNAVVNER